MLTIREGSEQGLFLFVIWTLKEGEWGDYMNKEYYMLDILKECDFEPYDDLGTMFSLKEFEEDVDRGCIMDYDGFGEVMIDGMIVSNSYVYTNTKTVFIPGTGSVSFHLLSEIFGNRAKICWYNK